MRAALNAGAFGAILVGVCSLLIVLLSGLFSARPLIYVSAMAGVQLPLVMAAAGALAWWASEAPDGPGKKYLAESLVAGLVAAPGGLLLCLATLSLTGEGRRLAIELCAGVPASSAFAGLATLLVVYVALAGAGGMLYDIVVPAAARFHS